MDNFKVFLGGMVGDCVQDCDELTKDIYQYFNGLIFCEHNSKDGTRELLESRKGDGEIISMPFLRNHGISMNSILTSHKLLPGDFLLFSDSLERISIDFAKDIRPFCENLAKQNINTVYSYGKILLIRYYAEVMFTPATPHCHIYNPRPQSVDLSGDSFYKNEKNQRYNIRGEKRPRNSFISHFLKYTLNYKQSNQMLDYHGGDFEKYKVSEELRQKFLIYWNRTLGQELTVEAFHNFIITQELPYELKFFLNNNRYLGDYFSYYTKKESLEQIIERHKEGKLYQIT